MRSDDTDALYLISVAARIAGMHAQTLRKYERAGFLVPSRTDGRLRLYSRDDMRRLRQIKSLVEERGMNLAGVEMALDLTTEMSRILAIVESADDLQVLREQLRGRVSRVMKSLDADA